MRPAYFPRLDGVRGIAILIVMAGHFLWMLPRHLGDFASLGVVLFFCLSGFLISNILLELPHRPGEGRRLGLFSFYARRSLRIFPIYYLTIALAALAGIAPVRDHFWRLACYAFAVPGLPSHEFGQASHLWSLSIEEQFYLIWPLLVVTLSRRLLQPVLLGVVALGIGYKVAAVAAAGNFSTSFRMLPASVDALGLGSLLALYLHDPGLRERCLPRLLAASRLVGWPCFVLLAGWRLKQNIAIHEGGYLSLALLLSSAALAAVSLLHAAVREGDGPLGAVLSFRPLAWIGKISYGLYMYHMFMPGVLLWAAGQLSFSVRLRAWVPLYFAASFLCAVVSWYGIERPILRLKRWFDYRHPAALAR